MNTRAEFYALVADIVAWRGSWIIAGVVLVLAVALLLAGRKGIE